MKMYVDSISKDVTMYEAREKQRSRKTQLVDTLGFSK
jgi:hypothetical protein